MTADHAALFQSYAGRRIVVLGASGFIGRWVARLQSACGSRLYLVVRNARAAAATLERYGVRGELIEVELRDAQAVAQMLHKIDPVIMFNLAGYGVDRSERDARTAYQINADLVDVIGKAAAGLHAGDWPGQQVVHVGSALEYGVIGGDLSEDSMPHPTTLYGQSKLAGTTALTRCCEAHGVRGLTARLFTVYGPGEHDGRLLPSLLSVAQEPRPLPLTAGRQKRDFTYVEDVAEGLLRLGVSHAAPGAIVNVATGTLTTARAFAETAARVLRIPRETLQFGAVPTRVEEMEHDPVAIAQVRRLLGWTPPTGIEEGIRKTWEFEHANDDTSHSL